MACESIVIKNMRVHARLVSTRSRMALDRVILRLFTVGASKLLQGVVYVSR